MIKLVYTNGNLVSSRKNPNMELCKKFLDDNGFDYVFFNKSFLYTNEEGEFKVWQYVTEEQYESMIQVNHLGGRA